jgi:hypothetical protein
MLHEGSIKPCGGSLDSSDNANQPHFHTSNRGAADRRVTSRDRSNTRNVARIVSTPTISNWTRRPTKGCEQGTRTILDRRRLVQRAMGCNHKPQRGGDRTSLLRERREVSRIFRCESGSELSFVTNHHTDFGLLWLYPIDEYFFRLVPAVLVPDSSCTWGASIAKLSKLLTVHVSSVSDELQRSR